MLHQIVKDNSLRNAVLGTDQGSMLQFGYCMTYEEGNRVSLFWILVLNVSNLQYIQLPKHLSELNRSIIDVIPHDPLSNEGRVCSQCKEEYALAINPVDYDCVKCSEKWCNIILYISMEFVCTCISNITVFYDILLVFRVCLTSPPMTCFIMYSQLIVYVMHTKMIEIERLYLQVYHKVLVRTLYGIFNLELFCVNNNIQLLGYVSALYLLHLITVSLKIHRSVLSYMIVISNHWSTCGDHFIDSVSRCIESGIQRMTSLNKSGCISIIFSPQLMYQSL